MKSLLTIPALALALSVFSCNASDSSEPTIAGTDALSSGGSSPSYESVFDQMIACAPYVADTGERIMFDGDRWRIANHLGGEFSYSASNEELIPPCNIGSTPCPPGNDHGDFTLDSHLFGGYYAELTHFVNLTTRETATWRSFEIEIETSGSEDPKGAVTLVDRSSGVSFAPLGCGTSAADAPSGGDLPSD